MVVKFNRKRHLREIEKWHLQHKMPFLSDLLPEDGWIVPGKAAIFLYKTKVPLAFMENLISNKEISKEERSSAINAVIEAGLKDAEESGIRAVVSITTVPQVVHRAGSLGGVILPKLYAKIVKEL